MKCSLVISRRICLGMIAKRMASLLLSIAKILERARSRQWNLSRCGYKRITLFVWSNYCSTTVFDEVLFVIDLEFVHANSKCYLKMSIIVIIGEQSSRYPFALFLGLYPSWSF